MNMELFKWMVDLDHWSPAQIYYFFEDGRGGRWCIYLRWWNDYPALMKAVLQEVKKLFPELAFPNNQ